MLPVPNINTVEMLQVHDIIWAPPKEELWDMITILVNWLGSVHGVFLWIIVLSGKKSGGVQQSASRLDHLDQRPCVSQHNNFIEIAPIPANYGRTFRARMVEIIPVEDPRCRCMHQRATAKVDLDPPQRLGPLSPSKQNMGRSGLLQSRGKGK